MSKLSKGERVAHKSLDDEDLGTAKTGIIKDILETTEQQMIITESDDTHELMAYDNREILKIGKPGGINNSPVLLRPKHVYKMLKTKLGLLVIMLSVVLGISLVVFANYFEWSLLYCALALGAIVLFTQLIAFVFDRRKIVDTPQETHPDQ